MGLAHPAELDVLTADLPASRDESSGRRYPATARCRVSTQPARREVAIQPAAHRPGRLRRLAYRFCGLAVPLVLVAGLVLAGPDGTSIFGSTTERVPDVADAQTDVHVSVLFGSVEVVIPDGAQAADTSGLVVFGSVGCDAACSGIFSGSDSTGQVVHVRAVVGFGSVQIKTASEAASGK